MYELTHIKGENKGKITLFALSTCIWCKKTREYLDNLGVEYDFVYVDLIENTDNKNKATDEIRKWNPACSFPTLVINDNTCIVGFKADQIEEALK